MPSSAAAATFHRDTEERGIEEGEGRGREGCGTKALGMLEWSDGLVLGSTGETQSLKAFVLTFPAQNMNAWFQCACSCKVEDTVMGTQFSTEVPGGA